MKGIESVLVVGSGPIGLLHMEILRSWIADLKLVVVDVSSSRLDFAERNEKATVLNARGNSEGFFSEDALKYVESPGYDLVIVATGNSAAFAEAIRSVRKAGTLLLFGAAHKDSMYPLGVQSTLLNELTITSSYATTEKELDEALSSLEKHEINVSKFITSSYRLESIEEAMTAARSETQVKVLVTA